MSGNRYFIDAENPFEDFAKGIVRKIVGYTDDLMVVAVHFNAGSVGEAHFHEEHNQISYVMSGKFEVTIDGEKKILIAGDAFTAKKNEMHGAVCLEKGILIDTFSPKRADFLEN